MGHNVRSSACPAQDNFWPRCRPRAGKTPEQVPDPPHMAGPLPTQAQPRCPPSPLATPHREPNNEEEEGQACLKAMKEAHAAEIARQRSLTQLEERDKAEELRAKERYHSVPEGSLCPSGLSFPPLDLDDDLEYMDPPPAPHSPLVPQGSTSGQTQC